MSSSYHSSSTPLPGSPESLRSARAFYARMAPPPRLAGPAWAVWLARRLGVRAER